MDSVPKQHEGAKAVLRISQLLPPLYSWVAAPLHRLLTKVNGFHCDSNCQNSFDELMNRLVSATIFDFPDFKEKFVLYTNVSDSAIVESDVIWLSCIEVAKNREKFHH
jgi:hypothetical protein